MRTFHHIGIPTAEKHDNETHLEDAKLYITDAAKSPNKIEWLRFEADSPMPRMLPTLPHIDLDDKPPRVVGRANQIDYVPPVGQRAEKLTHIQ